MSPELGVRAIGVIRTAHASFDDTAVQAGLNPDEQGVVELDDRFLDGLERLGGFSHAWLHTWLGPTDGSPPPEAALRQIPFLLQRSQTKVGIFAMRGAVRPNPIGLDGTPLLDLKPYFRDADSPDTEVRCGWFDSVDLDGPTTPGQLRRAESSTTNPT